MYGGSFGGNEPCLVQAHSEGMGFGREMSHQKLFHRSPAAMIHEDPCWIHPVHCTETQENKDCFSFSDPMSVARGSIPTAAPAGKRCLEGTSASSVSIRLPVKGTKGAKCHVGRDAHLTVERIAQ